MMCLYLFSFKNHGLKHAPPDCWDSHSPWPTATMYEGWAPTHQWEVWLGPVWQGAQNRAEYSLWETGSSYSVKKGCFCPHGPTTLPFLAATPVLSFSLDPARCLSQSDSSKWGHLQKLPLQPDKRSQDLAQACRGG